MLQYGVLPTNYPDPDPSKVQPEGSSSVLLGLFCVILLQSLLAVL